MCKFWGLVKNEYIKIFNNKNIIIIFIMLLLFVVGFYGFSKWNSSMEIQNDKVETFEQDIQSQINYYYSERPEGYLDEVEKLSFMLRNHIDTFTVNWKMEAVNQLANDIHKRSSLENSNDIKAKILAESIIKDKELIVKGDYRSYYQKKLEDVKNSDINKNKKEELIWRFNYILDNDIAKTGNEWKYQLYFEILQDKNELSLNQTRQHQIMETNSQRNHQLKDNINVNKYRIENNKRVIANADDESFYMNVSSKFWDTLNISINIMKALIIVVIIIAGWIVSSEFSSGTIYMLLINPINRGKILISKYVCVITFSFILMMGFYVLNILCAGIFFGFHDAGANYIFIKNNVIHEVSGLVSFGISYLFAFVPLMVYATLAFCLSSLTRNIVISVGTSIFFLFAGNSIVSLIKYKFQFDWGQYLLFANLDFLDIINGESWYSSQTVGVSIIIIMIHIVVFMLTGWDAFVRRDVK